MRSGPYNSASVLMALCVAWISITKRQPCIQKQKHWVAAGSPKQMPGLPLGMHAANTLSTCKRKSSGIYVQESTLKENQVQTLTLTSHNWRIQEENFVSFTGIITVAYMRSSVHFDSLLGTAAHSATTFFFLMYGFTDQKTLNLAWAVAFFSWHRIAPPPEIQICRWTWNGCI